MTSTAVPDAVIAVVRYSCRLPGAASPDAFWRLLAGGRNAISRVPADRWTEAELAADPTPNAIKRPLGRVHRRAGRWGQP